MHTIDRVAPALLFLALAVTMASAQAPDCTGVSGVFNQDPDLLGELTTRRIASGLTNPVFVTSAPGDLDRVFVVEQPGRIRVIRNGTLQATPFLDIGSLVLFGGEQGLLGLAFHPDYQTNRHFFVYHTNSAGDQAIARYTRSATSVDLADPNSRVDVITVPHPSFGNHNGGGLAFSPNDGRLYISVGDGGSGCDPGPGVGNGQSLTTNLGKILRLDVDQLPYTTQGNPFDGAIPGNDEIWSYGLRNPWRFSFDRVTGAILIGDVGQNAWEEIDCSPGTSNGGENYGWVNYEGDHCPNPSCGGAGCAIADYVPPIREYSLSGAPCAVTGGYVYRGCRMGDLRGTYFYSDACDDFVRTFRTDATCSAPPGPDVNREDDLEPGGNAQIASIVAYGQDERGELYLVDLGGEVYKILPTLSIMEVSGSSGDNPGPFPQMKARGRRFVWEDLEASSGHEIAEYRFYQSTGSPTGPFVCIGADAEIFHQHLDTPQPGEVLYFLVTAAGPTGEATHPGPASDGTSRAIDSGPCPG